MAPARPALHAVTVGMTCSFYQPAIVLEVRAGLACGGQAMRIATAAHLLYAWWGVSWCAPHSRAACPPPFVGTLQALFLTAAVVLGLTLYAFHATRQGTDLTFMGTPPP